MVARCADDVARMNASDVWLHGFFKYDWRDVRPWKEISPAKVGNRSGYSITRDASTPPQYPWKTGCRFLAVNSLTLLDAPGEYYVDRAQGKIYFYPPTPTLDKDVIVSTLRSVISATGSDNTVFQNIGMTVAQKNIVSIAPPSPSSTVKGINISSCSVSNSGPGACIAMSGVQDCHVSNSQVSYCGGQGISMASGNIKTLERGNSSIVDNRITQFARIIRTYHPGVAFHGVGMYVGGNDISYSPHCGIQGEEMTTFLRTTCSTISSMRRSILVHSTSADHGASVGTSRVTIRFTQFSHRTPSATIRWWRAESKCHVPGR